MAKSNPLKLTFLLLAAFVMFLISGIAARIIYADFKGTNRISKGLVIASLVFLGLGILFAVLASKSKFTNISEKKNKM